MSLGVYPIFRNPGFKHGYTVDGAALAREIESLDACSISKGLRPFSSFDSANIPLAADFVGDPTGLPEPEPSWFSPVDGLSTVTDLVRAVSFGQVNLAYPEQATEVLNELRALQRVLESAAESGECFQLKLG